MPKAPRSSFRTALLRVSGAAPMIAASLAMLTVEAAAYSKKVENACRSDYDTHCPAYKVGSAALLNCIELAGKRGNFSNGSFDALDDEGIDPWKNLKKR